MAMDGDDLGDAIKDGIDALSDEEKQDRTLIMRAMGTAIIDYIKNNAEVAVDVTSVSGVTAGGDDSGPGTGVGTIS